MTYEAVEDWLIHLLNPFSPPQMMIYERFHFEVHFVNVLFLLTDVVLQLYIVDLHHQDQQYDDEIERFAR